MKYTSAWRDFEIIATGDGEKLERWGKIVLLRPDPQAIWKPSVDYKKYSQIDGHYHRSATGGGAWEWLKPTPDEWIIKYKDLSFIISPMNFKHTGLFPEQAVNWDMVMEVIRKRPNARVLNLFAYTGGATVACAKAGAFVTHVDASRGMTDVAKRNVNLNKIPFENVRYIVDDCQKFVAREIRRGHKYDAIIMDPPNFGRGANGEIWKLTDNLNGLIANCVQLLSDNPLFILVNNYTASVQPAVIENVLRKNLNGLQYTIQTYEIGLPTKENLILPCGGASYVSFL
ncbi:MAG: class I SAM-dependent methyltransferase [Clostridia bacterium]|nr:class I SAM-dependent methyltransferase [Clostridia bacterium]